MKMLFIATALLTFQIAFSQNENPIERMKERKRIEKEVAYEHINRLDSSVLLVRLDFKSKEVAYYEKFDNYSATNKLRKKQLKINLDVIEAFEKRFDFCPVYFFAMKDSRLIVEGKMDSIVFYDVNGKPNKSIRLKEESFYIGEFGNVEQDKDGRKTSVPALILRDSLFNQLSDPFPFYEKLFPFAFIKSRYRSSAMKLNAKLISFKERAIQEKNQ